MNQRQSSLPGLRESQMVSSEGMREQLLCRELCYIQHHLSYGQMRTGKNLLRKILGSPKGRCFVEMPFWCTYGNGITVGENFRASHHLTILDAAQVTFGDHVSIGPNCRFHTAGYPQYAGGYAFVGENFRASHHLTILDAAQVTFGDHVSIGPNCRFHTAGYPQYAGGYAFASPITVGNWVWIGSGVTVLPGISIGDGTVVSAGSVVTSDLPPGVVAAGNPCRVIRFLTEGERQQWKS